MFSERIRLITRELSLKVVIGKSASIISRSSRIETVHASSCVIAGATWKEGFGKHVEEVVRTKGVGLQECGGVKRLQIVVSKFPGPRALRFGLVGLLSYSSTSYRLARSGVSGGVSGLKVEASAGHVFCGVAGCETVKGVRGEMVIRRGFVGLVTLVRC